MYENNSFQFENCLILVIKGNKKVIALFEYFQSQKLYDNTCFKFIKRLMKI